MKTALTLIILIISCLSCFAQNDSIKTEKNIIIENSADLDKYVGELITIKGEVTNTKIPTIIGVDISSDSPDLRGKKAIATGILERWIVDEKDIDKFSANRGVGTFYRIKDPRTNYEAQVQEIK